MFLYPSLWWIQNLREQAFVSRNQDFFGFLFCLLICIRSFQRSHNKTLVFYIYAHTLFSFVHLWPDKHPANSHGSIITSFFTWNCDSQLNMCHWKMKMWNWNCTAAVQGREGGNRDSEGNFPGRNGDFKYKVHILVPCADPICYSWCFILGL